jgi:exopolysaccharide production protein ExoZ
MGPKRIDNIQALRGIAVLLVVLFHTMVVERKYSGDRILPDWFDVGIAGVDLFFVISGCVIWTVTHTRFHQPQAVRWYLYNRVTRIYPAYWAYSLAVLAVFLVRPGLVNSSMGNQADLLSSFLLLPQALLPLLMVGWTLVHEIYFYLAFALFMLAPERHLVRLLAIWAALVVAGYVLWPIIGRGPEPSALRVACHPLTVEFIAGCFLAQAVVGGGFRSGARSAIILGILALAAGGACFVILAQEVLMAGVAEGWLRVALFGIPSVLLVYGAVAMEAGSGTLLPRWLRVIGDASYSIYLSHVLVLNLLGRLWRPVAVPGLADNMAALTLMIVVAILFGIASYRWLERPLLALSRKVLN